MTANLPQVLAKADPEMLKEILREAESYLGAQLTAALAGNQRAMTFSTGTAAATAVVGGAAGSLLLASKPHLELGVVCILIAFGFLVVIWNAMRAAAPITFGYVGSMPSVWSEDIEENSSLTISMAQQCAHYNKKITENRERLERSNAQLEHAMWLMLRIMVAGGLAASVVVALELRRMGIF